MKTLPHKSKYNRKTIAYAIDPIAFDEKISDRMERAMFAAIRVLDSMQKLKY